MRTATLLFAAALALRAQPDGNVPKDVLALFRTAAEALADQDASGFLDKFDRKMPGYEKLHDEVVALLDHADVNSSIEIVTDEGDQQKHVLELDWLLQIDMDQPRRQIVKCTIARQGKKWKITSLDPVEFFKPPS